jgi:hypothetical protein
MGRPTNTTPVPPAQIPVQGYTRWHNGREEVVGPYVRQAPPGSGAADPDPTLWHDPFPPVPNHAIEGGLSSQQTPTLADTLAQWTGTGSPLPAATFQLVGSKFDIPCQGYSSGCECGGTYGTSAMYRAFNRFVCLDCASKMFCLDDMTALQRTDYLSKFLINGGK